MTSILVVSECFWPEGTGGILATYLITHILQDAGYGLTIIHGTKQPKVIKGVDYIYTDLLSARNKHILWLGCLALTKQNWFGKAAQKCDVVYIPQYCYPIIPFVKKYGKKVIVHLHGYQPVSYNAVIFNDKKGNSYSMNIAEFEILEHGSISRAIIGALTASINKLCRIWLSKADTIICVSKRQAEIISSLAPELARKIVVIYNPLPNVPAIEDKLKQPTFVYAGGGSYVKGFHVFIRGALNILKRGKNADFLLLGGSGHRYEKLIERLSANFKDRFNFLGHLPYEDVLRLYSKSHAVLVPSICEETFSYVVTESMLAGTIPIASRIGGISEIVQGTYAEEFLFEPGDADELTDKMEMILSMSKEEIKNGGLALREAVQKKFNKETIQEELLKVLLG